jgi:phage terminase large subunit GpA-like protein
VIDLATIAATLARSWSPPPAPPLLVDFARRFRWTEGTRAGDQIVPEQHPAQLYALRAIGAGLLGRSIYRRFVFLKPTQDGGTWICLAIPLIYCTTQLARPFVAGFPDMRLAGVCWRQKTRAPILKAGRGDWLPSSGPGSDGNSTPVEVALAGTPSYWIGGGASNEAGQASITGAVLARDELDSMEPYVAELMSGRLDAYGASAVTIDLSTIKHDEGSAILAAYEAGTALRLAYPCPHCDGFQTLDWERVAYDAGSQLAAMTSARLACAHCAVALTDQDRLAMITSGRAVLVGRGQELQRDGSVTGDLAATITWSQCWTALDSPIKSLGQLAAQHWDAVRAAREGNHALMRRFSRDRLCRPYLADRSEAASVDATALALRSAHATYARGTAPAWVEFATLTVDVQKREAWWVLLGHGAGGRWAVIDWGRELIVEDFRAEPIDDQVWAALDRIEERAAQGWPQTDADAELRPLLRGVDVGFQADAVHAWLDRQSGAWLAVRGAGDGQLSDRPVGGRVERIEGWLDVRDGPSGLTHYCEADHIKEVIVAAFAREDGTPGSASLPHGQAADDWLIKQLTAERRVGAKWVRIRKDNHLFDTAVYGLALAKLAGPATAAPMLPVWGRR